MKNQYHIQSNNFFVQDYSYVLKKKHNKLEIDTNVEVLGDFYLPERTLKISHLFSHQLTENNYLRVDRNKKCVNKNQKYLNNCYVLKNSSFINISNDKFFSQELNRPSDVEFTTKFDIDSNDVLSNESLVNTSKIDFYKFIDNLKHQSIHNKFKYQNTHTITKEKWGPLNKTVNLFNELHIQKNKSNRYIYDPLNVRFFDYSNNKNQYIKNWFALDLKENWFLSPTKQYLDFNFEDERHVYDINKQVKLKKNLVNNTSIVQFLTSFVKNSEKGFWFENLHSETGLFFTKPTNGYLITETRLFRQNNTDNIKFSNFFAFQNNLEIDKKKITTVYQGKKTLPKFAKYQSIEF